MNSPSFLPRLAVVLSLWFPRSTILVLGFVWVIVLIPAFFGRKPIRFAFGFSDGHIIAAKYCLWLVHPLRAIAFSHWAANGLWWFGVAIIAAAKGYPWWAPAAAALGIVSYLAAERTNPVRYLARAFNRSGLGELQRKAFVIMDYETVFWPDEWSNLWPLAAREAYLVWCQQRPPVDYAALVAERTALRKALE